jgi:hypothetical protein
MLPRSPLVREDPELGAVRLCRGCGDEWPLDEEFWYFHLNRHGKRQVMGRCRACWSDRKRIQGRKQRFAPMLLEGSIARVRARDGW